HKDRLSTVMLIVNICVDCRRTAPFRSGDVESLILPPHIETAVARSQRCRLVRRILVRLLIFAGATILVIVGTAILLFVVDPRPPVEFLVSRSLDRPVSIGTLNIRWGNPLSIEMQNVHLANPGWARDADMLRVDFLSADVDSRALW